MRAETYEYLRGRIDQLQLENDRLKRQLASFTDPQGFSEFADSDDFSEQMHERIQQHLQQNGVTYTEAMKAMNLTSY